MRNIIPRVAALHSLAGFGRSSLAVILPVLSAIGVQACPVPTAVLSTHSGGFPGFTFVDQTVEMEACRTHWKTLDLHFDCLYSGFLGSAAQIDVVLAYIRDFRQQQDQLIVVDPVMGDNGDRYKTYTDEMQQKMSILIHEADLITPNLTEACFLLNESYPEPGTTMGIEQSKEFLTRLAEMGPNTVVLTGLKEDRHYCNLAYQADKGLYWRVRYEQVPVSYPGTGDLFASALTGCLLTGDSLPMALDRATQFLSLAVRTTYGHGTPQREGVLFEKVLPFFCRETPTWSYHTI